jgi:predicted HTH transcriptional regulator
VLSSALKTIVAFSNSRGGTLLIGIEDNGNPVGIEGDYPLMTKFESSFDGWELMLRSSLEQQVHNGLSLNSYVAVQRITVGQCTIARLQIAPRSRLSFLKRDNRLDLYVRSGNRSIPVPLEEIENFFEMKKRYL